MTEEHKSDEVQAAPDRRPTGSTLVEALKHPMVLLATGSLLTYLIVPAITTKINQHRTQAQAMMELKLKEALQISLNSIEFEGKINMLRAVLETFHDNQVDLKLKAGEFHQAQMELVKEFNTRRFALGEKEWWWLRDLQRDSAIYKLIAPSKLDQFNHDVQRYEENVGESHAAMEDLWRALRAPTYKPGDEASEKVIPEIRTKMAQDAERLRDERTEIIKRISDIFVLEDN